MTALAARLDKFLLASGLILCSLLVQAAPRQAAIATPHPLATEAARQILDQGGNAFDAAITVSAVLAVVEPYGSGIGGGGFYLLREAGETANFHFLDARERAPLKAHEDLYRRDGKVQRELSLNGALAAAIPGLPAALVELADTHATLPLSQTLAPAIQLAEQGFPVDRIYRNRAQIRLSALRADPESAHIFLVDDQVPAEGHPIRQPDLANTLHYIAEHGREGFYQGELANTLVAEVQGAGGVWTLEDLQSYQVQWRAPLRVSLADGRELISAPPPSAGGVMLAQSLAILQHLPWQETTRVQQVHLISETLRRAYRDRGLLGDPDFIDNPVDEMLDADYLQQLAAGIDPNKATPSTSLQPSIHWQEGDHTTHFAVLDTQGNAVAATLSINLPFGAAFTVPGTGVLLNDEMDDFAADVQGHNNYGLEGSKANAIAAGKRPLSSMAPTFIESPDELAAFGTPGGSRIPSMNLLAILAYLDGQPVEQWPAVKRFHHQFMPDAIQHEPDAFSAGEAEALQKLGHQLKSIGRQYGNQQVLYWNKLDDSVKAASDPRGIGRALP